MPVRYLLGVVLGTLLLSLGASGCAHRTIVQVPGANAAPPGLSVIGTGEAKAPPDIARSNVGVEVRAETVEQATTQSNQRMSAILDALRQIGIAESDMRTHSFSISFEHAPMPPVPWPQGEVAPDEPAARGKAAPDAPSETKRSLAAPTVRGVYRASNMVEVTIRDLSKTGQVLQKATDAGANNIWGISFELEDPRPLLAEARAKAVEHAKQNAEALARLSGVELGQLVSISEGGGGPGPMPVFEMKTMDARGGGDVPIERGEVTVNQQVQLVYALPASDRSD